MRSRYDSIIDVLAPMMISTLLKHVTEALAARRQDDLVHIHPATIWGEYSQVTEFWGVVKALKAKKQRRFLLPKRENLRSMVEALHSAGRPAESRTMTGQDILKTLLNPG